MFTPIPSWRNHATCRNPFTLALILIVFAAVFRVGSTVAVAAEPETTAVQATAVQPAENDQDNPHLWKPQTRSVAVFKNGLGFFMREGDVQLRDGWCVAEEIPPALFGTLAIYALDEKQTVDIVGSGPGEVVQFDGRDAPKDAATKRARLEASKNLSVQLHYEYKGQDREAAGKLVSVGPEFVVLDGGGNSFAVPLEGITKMQVLDLPLRVHVQNDEQQSVEKGALGLAYLRKGIIWIPDYTLKVLDDETAELTLRGTVVNAAEDLIHTDVHLVVGVPHFTHTDYMAPVAVDQMIRSIGAAMTTQGIPQQVTTQMMNRAAIVQNTAPVPGAAMPEVVERPAAGVGGDLNAALGNLPQMEGAAATDYTVYTKRDVTLRCGEKAIITLFTWKIRYSHVYRWSPPQGMEHFLVLHNQTNTAWTTGPCLAVSAERPLSEDLLKYTPKGSDGEFPVTAAINIAHNKVEREIDRKLKAHSPAHEVYFDLVTLEGKVNLVNYEKRPVRIVISNAIPGKPLEADGNGRISVDPDKLKLLERAGTIDWTVELEPGQHKTLTYIYERYVPSY